MSNLDAAAGARLPRRTLLKSVTAVAGGLALTQSGLLPPLDVAAAPAENVQDILNITVTTEMFGVTFLGAAIDSNQRGGFNPPIPAPVIAILQAARGQEQAHLEFFQSLGGRPLTQVFNIPNPALLTNPTLFFDTLQAQETREVAAQIAAMLTFAELRRPDLAKVSFQYAAEEAEHRLLANYAKGARPANNYGFAPALYGSVAAFLADLRQLGIVGGSGPAAMYPGPGAIDFSNVIERTPGGPSARVAGVPAAPAVVAAPVVAAPAPAPAPAPATNAETVFAVTPNNLLLRFSSASAQVIDRAVTITGLQPGETLLGIDFRPANKQLYAVGGTSRIYTINTDTGAATAVGGQFTPRIVGRVYGFDFNPMADAIRLVSSEDQNLRISPTTGQVVGTDANLAYVTGDTNAGKNIIVTGAAYTNNTAGATSTQLYVIDAANDTLGRIDTPNNGQVRTVGALGGGAGGYVGFDIANGVAYATFSTATSSSGTAINSPFEPAFGTIDLTTGKFTPLSPIGVAINNLEIVGVAVQPR